MDTRRNSIREVSLFLVLFPFLKWKITSQALTLPVINAGAGGTASLVYLYKV